MCEKTYLFRREDNDEIVEVDFQTMMEQDLAGYITLPDGVEARRCWSLEASEDAPRRRAERGAPRETVSDALGFCDYQLREFEADRRANGFRGIEFTRDPTYPHFIQVRAKSRREYERYAKHRGAVNKTGTGGVLFSKEELERARELATRGRHGRSA